MRTLWLPHPLSCHCLSSPLETETDRQDEPSEAHDEDHVSVMAHMSQERTDVSSNFLSRLLVTDHSSAAATTARVFHLQSLPLPSIQARPDHPYLAIFACLFSTTAYVLSIEICCKVAVTDGRHFSSSLVLFQHSLHIICTILQLAVSVEAGRSPPPATVTLSGCMQQQQQKQQQNLLKQQSTHSFAQIECLETF